MSHIQNITCALGGVHVSDHVVKDDNLTVAKVLYRGCDVGVEGDFRLTECLSSFSA